MQPPGWCFRLNKACSADAISTCRSFFHTNKQLQGWCCLRCSRGDTTLHTGMHSAPFTYLRTISSSLTTGTRGATAHISSYPVVPAAAATSSIDSTAPVLGD